MSEKQTKKRKKSYYINSTKQKKAGYLDSAKHELGFLITFDSKFEKKATIEADIWLSEVADALWGPEISEDGDNEAEERAILKGEKVGRFTKVRTEIFSVFFMSTTIEDPIRVAEECFERLVKPSSGLPFRPRNLLRLLPVVKVCKAQLENIKSATLDAIVLWGDKVMQRLTTQGKEQPSRTFMLSLKVRHNEAYHTKQKHELLRAVAAHIYSSGNDWTPDLKEPTLVINIDILKRTACISLLPHYKRFLKYNPCEIVKANASAEAEKSAVKEETVEAKSVVKKETIEAKIVVKQETGVGDKRKAEGENGDERQSKEVKIEPDQ